LPSLQPLYRKQPSHLIRHLLGHEGPGSILSLLKKKGWADKLSAGSSARCDDFELFVVSVTLSENGIEFVEEIVKIIFQYIRLIEQQGLQQWIHEEITAANRIQFRFMQKREPINYVCELAENLHDFSPEHVIFSHLYQEDFDPELIRQVLKMLSPNNFNLYVSAREYESSADLEEPWYRTKYSRKPMSADWIKMLESVDSNKELSLPAHNEFIPSDFLIKNQDEPLKYAPSLVLQSNGLLLWHKKDDTFLVPKSSVIVSFFTNALSASPKSVVSSLLLENLLHDALSEYSYYAEIVGLSFSTEMNSIKWKVKVSGYNEKLPLLTRKVFQTLKNLQVDPARFILKKQELQRQYRNFKFDQPYRHSDYYWNILLRKRRSTLEEKERALEALTMEDVQKFLPELLSKADIEAFIHGNIMKEEAVALMEEIRGVLGSNPLFDSEFPEERIIQLPKGISYVYEKEGLNPQDSNSCIFNFYQIGARNIYDDVLLDLVCQINDSTMYDVLRTKEQLGYIVWSGSRCQGGIQGFRVLVQSQTYCSAYLNQRIENCMEICRENIMNLTETEFAEHVNILIARKMEKDKKLEAETQRHWSEISTRSYQFDRVDCEVEQLRKVTQREVVDFFDKHLRPSSSARAKLSIQNYAPSKTEEQRKFSLEKNEKEHLIPISDIGKFKRESFLWPFVNTGYL